METQSNNLLNVEHAKEALKLFLSAFFISAAGMLFWSGFHPMLDAIDDGISVIRHAHQFMFMFQINIAGALMCLVYAAMPYFPSLLKSNRSNEEGKIQNATPEKCLQNNIGSVGFIIASVSIVLGWIPAFGWLLLMIALITCIIGITKNPRWLALLGFLITIIAIIEVICFGYIIDYFKLLLESLHVLLITIC